MKISGFRGNRNVRDIERSEAEESAFIITVTCSRAFRYVIKHRKEKFARTCDERNRSDATTQDEIGGLISQEDPVNSGTPSQVDHALYVK